MKILLNNFELCRGNDSLESPVDLIISGKQDVHILKAIQAASVKTITRGNLSNHISFSVQRDHSSPEAANAFTLLHATEANQHSGDLSFIPEPGEDFPRLTLQNAALTKVTSKSFGLSTYHSYQITGGALCK